MSKSSFGLVDEATGKLNIDKCLAFARNCPTTNRENGTASDEVLEILEVVVPGLIAELRGISEKEIDRSAELVFDRAKEGHLAAILKALDGVDIKASLMNVTFTMPPIGQSRDDPMVVTATVPQEQWGLVQELNSRLTKIKNARNNNV